MGLYSGGLIIGRICASEIWGAYFQEGFFFWGGGAYCRNFMLMSNSPFVSQVNITKGNLEGKSSS